MAGRLDTSRPVSREVRHVIADAEAVAVEWTTRATTRDGTAYENDYAFVFEVRDGLICAVREYFDTAKAHRVLFGTT